MIGNWRHAINEFFFSMPEGKRPQVLPTALLHACSMPVAESHFFMMCGPQLSFLSSVTPR